MPPEEEVEDYIEQRKTAAYGPPEVRLARNKAYVAELVEAHSEKLIRDLLKAMQKACGPVRKRRRSKETDFDTVPLERILRRYDLPWFYFKAIEVEDGVLRADVTHGILMAARGERFVFEIKDDELMLVEHSVNWIS